MKNIILFIFEKRDIKSSRVCFQVIKVLRNINEELVCKINVVKINMLEQLILHQN